MKGKKSGFNGANERIEDKNPIRRQLPPNLRRQPEGIAMRLDDVFDMGTVAEFQSV